MKIVWLSAMLLMVGCGTVSERIARSDIPPQKLYEGTSFDAALIASPFWDCHGPECGFLSDSLLIEASACLVGVISIPVSLTVDTLMAPIDAYKINRQNK